MDEHAPIVYDVTPYNEETSTWNVDPSAYLLRYYTKYYFLETDGKSLKNVPASSVEPAASQSVPKIIDHETGLEVLRGDQFVYQSPNKLCVTGLAPTHPLIAQPDRYKVLSIRFDHKIQSALPQPTAIPANSKKQPPPPCQPETVICKVEALDLKELERSKTAQENTEKEIVGASERTSTTPSGSILASSAEASAEASSTSSPSSSSSSSAAAAAAEVPTTTTKTSRSKNAPAEHSIDPTRVIFVVRSAISGHVIELNERLMKRATPIITDADIIKTLLEKASTHGFVAVIRPKIDNTEIALKDLCTMDKYNAMRQTADDEKVLSENVE
ncbi:hypothetical protein BGZ70_009327 [Mortierella alpina]|uniref:Uncharacterized protein n=1 Tax=Mortierella alpina TaxID=64518 RepID=A0A9P6M6G2_MORAP|nr:hypothetical protein BGZ70_009327 [Mortierella alpina]